MCDRDGGSWHCSGLDLETVFLTVILTSKSHRSNKNSPSLDGWFCTRSCTISTEKSNNEDNKDKDADTVKDGCTSKITELLEPFCS